MRERNLSADTLEAVRFTSSSVRHEFPIRKLQDDDIEFIDSEISKILDDFPSESGTVGILLRECLCSIKETAKNYQFLGSESLIREVESAFVYMNAAQRRASNDKEKKAFADAKSILMAIIIFFGALIHSDDAITASSNWFQRLKIVVNYLSDCEPLNGTRLPSDRRAISPPGSPLRLPAPKQENDGEHEHENQESP